MRNSKTLVSQALKTIVGNLARTGDPLGIKTIYWTRWAKGLHLPRRGDALLYTARMYQMLPYVVRATKMTAAAKLVLPMLKVHPLARILETAGALAADPVLRLQGGAEHEIRRRGETALKGMVAALGAAGIRPAYLHEAEPYSGVLLHDLGMENEVAALARSVYRRLKASGARTIITTDPHTTFMLREIYPRFVPGFDLDVRHYLQVLANAVPPARGPSVHSLPQRVVFHDSCVMARDLGIVNEPRTVLARIGIQFVEPESHGRDTACCGGPVEYAFAELSHSISGIRARELAAGATHAVVTCPICLINLIKHQKPLGTRVWDLGELLGMAGGHAAA